MRSSSGRSRVPAVSASRSAAALLLAVLVLLLGLVPSAARAHEGDEPPTDAPTTDVSVPTDPDDASGDTSDDTPVVVHAGAHGLASSWPADGVMLWVPPKEGRLTFTDPVRSSTMTVTLSRTDGFPLADDEVVRLTSGESVTEVLLRLPQIRPGGYEIAWSVTSAAGEALSGTLGFGLEEPIAAVGGQNHRHGESHLYEDTPGQFALRLVFVLAVAFLFAGVRRSRARATAGPVEKLSVRLGAGLLVLGVLVAAIADAVTWIDEYHDKPFSALVAAPGLSLLLPMLAFAVYLVVSARTTPVVLWSGVGVLAAYAGLSHAIRTALGAELFVVFTVLLSSLALLWAELISTLLGIVTRKAGEAVTRLRVLLAAAGALLVSSLLMLLLHAGTLDLQMAFARDLRSRLVFGVLLAASLGAIQFLASRRRLLRVLVVIPVTAVLVVSALLAWMPPPAAGL